MTTPTVVPVGYDGTDADYLKVTRDPSGAVRSVAGSVVVPNATAAGAFIGLVPFQAGARFIVDSTSVYITDIDAGTDSLLNLGIIYDDNVTFTDDVDAFASGSTVGRTAGFIAVDEIAGMTLTTQGNGWLAVENDVNATESEGTITFSVGVVYDQ